MMEPATMPTAQEQCSSASLPTSAPPARYRLYKMRFSGISAFVLLGVITGLPYCWFGPISTDAAKEFGITVDQVNWLGIIVAWIYFPVGLIVPVFCSRFGIRRCAQLGTLMVLISGWVRYSGTITSLNPRSTYALLMFGQIFSAIAQPVFQVLGPMYSEKWFDLQGRTTATMVIAIANPIGNALGQLISPMVSTPRQSILVLAIISTAAIPAVFLIKDAPPTPPTYAGSKPPKTLMSLFRAMLGLSVPPEAYMTRRERVDIFIIVAVFATLVAAVNALSVLSAQWFTPFGYSNTISGAMGAVLLFSGILAAIVTAPLFDRLFTRGLGIALRICIPIIACCWLSLIWAIRPNNTAALFVIMTLIGVLSMIIMPVGLELGVEVTRNADGSSALMWGCSDWLSNVFILVEQALRAPATANPPSNMHNAIIFQGTVIMVVSALIFFLRGQQARREMDEFMAQSRSSIPLVPDNAAAKNQEATRDTQSKIVACDVQQQGDS